MTPLQVLLAAHIAAGTCAFIAAPIALITTKGSKTHRTAGKFFFWSMAAVAFSAVILAIARPILFLALVAVFSFYAAFSGYRVLYRKQPLAGNGPKAIDWIAALFTFAVSLALFFFGTFTHVGSLGKLGPTAGVFGIIGMVISGGDLRQFIKPPTDKNFWWFNHMFNMIGSYIAAVTAFSAVVIGPHLGQTPIVWFWPTAVGVPLMLLWGRSYRKKFALRRATAVPSSRAAHMPS